MAAGPWLTSWRTSAPFFARYLVNSMVLSALVVLWAYLALVWEVTLSLSFLGQTRHPEAEFFVSADRVIEGVPWTWVGGLYLVALLGCLWSRQRLLESPCQYPEGRGRRVVGLVLMLPLGCSALALVGVAILGARLDAELVARYQPDVERALAQGGDSLRQRRLAALPPLWSSSSTLASPEEVERWLASVRRLWVGPNFWSSPELRSLCWLARYRSVLTQRSIPEAARAEVAVRCSVVLLEQGVEPAYQIERLSQMSLPAEDWRSLQGVILSRSDLAQGVPQRESHLDERLFLGLLQLQQSQALPSEDRKSRRFFERSLERLRLNRLGRALVQAASVEPPGQPSTPEQVRLRYPATLEFDLLAVQNDSRQASFPEEVARPSLGYQLALFELKRRQAAGEPYPQRWEEFPEEFQPIVLAYREWMRLTPEAGGVELLRQDARGGFHLTHRFSRKT